ncbi:MAG: hypothetical protein LBE84_05925 [Planctomycetota bacterium]|nr:hypothetical protein [Planctomycetota bacterium]
MRGKRTRLFRKRTASRISDAGSARDSDAASSQLANPPRLIGHPNTASGTSSAERLDRWKAPVNNDANAVRFGPNIPLPTASEDRAVVNSPRAQ